MRITGALRPFIISKMTTFSYKNVLIRLYLTFMALEARSVMH